MTCPDCKSSYGASRVVVWFSCGAASACAAKLASKYYGDELRIVYCDTSKDEHPDNARFMADIERWVGRKVITRSSSEFNSVTEVFLKTSYISGPRGARCTVEMKKVPRLEFQQPDDVHIFGYTADEPDRIRRFREQNPELRLEWILRNEGMTKQNCYDWIRSEGIILPTMYLLGYRNNNCLGCVKSTSPGYWNKIRGDFPDVFQERATVSRQLGVRLIQLNGVRIFLDELPAGIGKYKGENISCGPECGTSEGAHHVE